MRFTSSRALILPYLQHVYRNHLCTGMGDSKLHTVYVALGTNLGDRVGNMRLAMESVRRVHHKGARDFPVFSRVYETAAEYVTDQPPFLNAAVKVGIQVEILF